MPVNLLLENILSYQVASWDFFLPRAEGDHAFLDVLSTQLSQLACRFSTCVTQYFTSSRKGQCQFADLEFRCGSSFVQMVVVVIFRHL